MNEGLTDVVAGRERGSGGVGGKGGGIGDVGAVILGRVGREEGIAYELQSCISSTVYEQQLYKLHIHLPLS